MVDIRTKKRDVATESVSPGLLEASEHVMSL